MAKTYRAGVIGCGGIARAHSNGYKQIPNVQIVAAADVSEEQLKNFSQEYGAENLYTDYNEMLEKEELDLVSICTWPPLHREMTVKAAEHGIKGILCEKPMALNLAEVDEMIEACDKSGSVLAIGHQRRFEAQYATAQEMIESGEIGELIKIHNICRGDLLSDATHSVDLIRFYNSDDPIEFVIGQTDDRKKRTRYGHDIEDSAIAYIKFKNGVRAFMEVGDITPATYQQAYIDGTEGRIEVNPTDGSLLKVKGKGDSDWRYFELEWGNPFRIEIEEMIESIETGKEHPLNGRQGRAALEVLMAVYESSRLRQAIELPMK